MTFTEYRAYFESIIQKSLDEQAPPYDNPSYINYTRLNWTRMNRWFKTGKLSAAFVDAVKSIDQAQQWIVITEPWCGDAAHSVPFIEMAAALNPLITVSYELRDAEPFRISSYLTNGGKSIPKLIVRDAQGEDLTTWGPRPAGCQSLYDILMKEQADIERIKTDLQNWYNADKGKELMLELAGRLVV